MLNEFSLTEYLSLYAVHEAEFPGKHKHKIPPAGSSVYLCPSQGHGTGLSWQETQQDKEQVYRDTVLNLCLAALFSVHTKCD